MVIMTGKAALSLFPFALLRLGNLVAMAAATGSKAGTGGEILLRRAVADDAFDVHQPVFSVKPGLFLVSVAFAAFLVPRNGRMFPRSSQHHLRLHEQTQANQYEQSLHDPSFPSRAAATTVTVARGTPPKKKQRARDAGQDAVAARAVDLAVRARSQTLTPPIVFSI